ncbi:diguanylate cyclase [Lottiidibacillus patelloidae]|uniref:Diguanylate cyclase n=1 Tax=Lottiidibacillus patelloidae TaxID=2670334 RepID=A0A263BYG2_9BACI|nr:dipeptidase [Lottiidibacillus patelloidae]OZM58648.1 diguanylate cyclase [Lottiidibacillus patelloidae]
MIFDAHCDVLYKMWKNPALSFEKSADLHVTFAGLKKANVKVQCFAIFIPPEVPSEQKFNVALEMIDIFYRKVLPMHPELKLVRTSQEINSLKHDEIGIMLTLEGCDCIGNDLIKLRTLFRLGVRSVGLTWNYANAVADGALEKRNGGLSNFGIETVKLINEAYSWTDVSHLSEQSFWDTIELAKFPIASHSNARKLCNHPRNLTDEQIKALIKRNAPIGITFVPMFLSEGKSATVRDVLNQIEYICSLGGENNIGFGSDFDGIDETVIGLENVYQYEYFSNELLKLYKDDIVRGFLFNNFFRRLPI